MKKGSALLEIIGPVPPRILKRLYKRVAYRLPVFSKMIKQKQRKNICFDSRNIQQNIL